MNVYVGIVRGVLEKVHGGKVIGLIHSDGEGIFDLAIAHDLTVCNTFFPKREIQKLT